MIRERHTPENLAHECTTCLSWTTVLAVAGRVEVPVFFSNGWCKGL
jgi:hypothetical protein